MFNEKEYNRQYYKAHKAKIIAQGKLWAKNNPDSHRKAFRKYYEKNKAKVIAKIKLAPKYKRKWVWVNGKHICKYEHRLVMEQILGRELRPDEFVHHIDGNRQNNDPANLKLVDSLSHAQYHRKV